MSTRVLPRRPARPNTSMASARAPSNAASEIERRLAREILRGRWAPGSQLPPVRELARTSRVAAPTIQRVIDRLEASGLVSARRGSGVTVNDPRRSRDLSLLPLWFDALSDEPDRAAAILADFLELRRVVAGHLVRTAADKIAAAGPRLVELLAEVEGATTLTEVIAADLAFTGAVVDAADQFAVGAVFQTTDRLVREVPHVAEALYEDRAQHRRALRRVAGALAGAGPCDAAAELEAALASWDARTVARFRERLREPRPAARGRSRAQRAAR